MSSREVADVLKQGRARGVTRLWFGGGEPTLRRDMLKLVKYARKLGYDRVKLQTNGMMLSYPKFSTACVEAGVTDISFCIKGPDAETHDRLAQTEGCFDAMVAAIKLLENGPIRLDGDILMYRSNLGKLVETIELFDRLGLRHFDLWHLSTFDVGDRSLDHEVPTLSDVVRMANRTTDSLGLDPDRLTLLFAPPCTLCDGRDEWSFSAADLDLVIANPGQKWFWLEESPFEGGTFLDECVNCSQRARCNGIRADYLAIHGGDEFVPLGDD